MQPERPQISKDGYRNDSCERAIALAKDYYAILTKDSRVRRMICQVVEQDRREFPNVSKRTLGKR